ncbi:C40 family peptidase [Paenibacillus protaetiae]|nr:C40 family peptidase [Paenibacillus protaetiae]
MTNNWMKKTLIATACCFTLVSAGALTGTSHVGQAYAATSATTAKADSIITAAKSLQGKVTYKFGVNNPSKLVFDCSSFTKYVFGKYGVNLKWGTASQSKQGVYVSKSSLKKGDLIFFNNGKSSAISHVGIYMGNGKFIHNTIGTHINGIMINNLSDYTKRYVTARRVL